LYLLGVTRDELRMSCYFQQTDQDGTEIPDVNLESNQKIYRQYYLCAQKGLIRAAHDCSDGGLAITAAEMVMGSEFGIEFDLATIPYDGSGRDDFVLFSESNGRILVEVDSESAGQFEDLFRDIPMARIGRVISDNHLVITRDTETLVAVDGEQLYHHWAAPIAAVL
jgi:phosphoribosylformylglycinamidine synthase